MIIIGGSYGDASASLRRRGGARGNFSRAAEQCHVSQPSLSKQIQKLEEELGERLFDRMKREAKMTPHGEAFLPRALKILEEVDVAKREASDAHSLLRGRVILGVLPTIAPYPLPEVLVDFVKTFPGVEIVFTKTPRRGCSSFCVCWPITY
jgi:LysR family transcriptional regulator, hydrogen peroxide-inducible genes activator